MEWLEQYYLYLLFGGIGMLVTLFAVSFFWRTAWGVRRYKDDEEILHKDLETDAQKRLRYLRHLEDNRD